MLRYFLFAFFLLSALHANAYSPMTCVNPDKELTLALQICVNYNFNKIKEATSLDLKQCSGGTQAILYYQNCVNSNFKLIKEYYSEYRVSPCYNAAYNQVGMGFIYCLNQNFYNLKKL